MISDSWDRGPQPWSRRNGDHYVLLCARYRRLMRTLRDALGDRTLGQTRRLVDRAAKVAEAYAELCRMGSRLEAYDRD